MTETKVGSRCGKEKPLERFPVGTSLKRGARCYDCVNEVTKQCQNRHNDMPWYDDWILKDTLRW